MTALWRNTRNVTKPRPSMAVKLLALASSTPEGRFDAIAQANAKMQIEQLGKRIPCGSSGRGGAGDTCVQECSPD